MSLTAALGVGLVGGAGAIARFLLDGAVTGRTGSGFPSGTLLVNVVGAFLLGLLVGAAVSRSAYQLEGTGFIGGFTTFSTWMLETQRLGEDGELRLGFANAAISLAAGLAAAWAGRYLGNSL